MKIQVQASQLAEALTWILPAVKRNPTMPILSGVMITADEDTVQVAAFDYDMAMRATIDATVAEPGQCLVGARVLRDLTAKMRGDVALVAAGSSLTLACGRSNYDLGLMPTAEYPAINLDAPQVGRVAAEDLVAALHRVDHALAAADSLPILAGIHMIVENGRLRVDATDRYRMARTTMPYTGEDFEATPDGKVLIDITKGLTGSISIGYSDKDGQLVLADADRCASLRLLAEAYPKFDGIISGITDKFRASINRLDLLGALDRLNQIREKNEKDPMLLEFSKDGHCEVRASENDARRSGVELIDCDTTHDTTAGFNPRYLADALKAHNAETVTFTNSDPQAQMKPTLVSGDEHVITITMPIKLNRSNG